jgi:hypothetical protein
MAHAHSPESIKRAVRAGVRSIEHGTYLDQESAEMMVERGTWLVPTLTAGDTTEELAKDPKLAPEIRAKFEGLGRPEFDAMRLAAEVGIKVAMGTDCPGRSPRLEPQRAHAHGGERLHAGRGAGRGHFERRGAHGPAGPARDACPRQDRGRGGGGRDPFEFEKLKERIEQVWKDGVRVV